MNKTIKYFILFFKNQGFQLMIIFFNKKNVFQKI